MALYDSASDYLTVLVKKPDKGNEISDVATPAELELDSVALKAYQACKAFWNTRATLQHSIFC